MATFPGALPSYAGFTASHTLAADSHAAQHNAEQADITALGTKIGTGASTPASGLILRGTGAGTSAWGQAVLTSDVSGVLPQANGGTGTTLATGTGKAVYDTSPTISGAALTASPTLTTPTIADYTNATHTHATNAQGGQLNAANALQNTTVSASKLNTGAQADTIDTLETTSSATFTDLTTPGPSVTVTVGANGLALIVLTGALSNNTAGDYAVMGFTASGANTIAATANDALQIQAGSTTNETVSSWSKLLTGLTAGSTTFTAKYERITGGTATFRFRRLAVIPL